MDFGALPPEINSARIYSGPGSEPLLAAEAAWDGLAGELQSMATSYDALIADLTNESWSGPSSVTMAAAAAPYAAWMSTTAEHAQQTARQAHAAAGAYQTALAAAVPPALIAANRAQLAALVATNIVGQNAAAIAAIEAQYTQMWAQDAAAMYNYAGLSAAATQVTPFNTPPPTTNAVELIEQHLAVGQEAGASIGANAQSALTAVPLLLQELASASSSWNSTSGGLLNSITGSSSTASLYQSLFTMSTAASRLILPANATMISTIMGMVQFQKFYRPGGLAGALGGWLPNLGAGLGETGAAGMPSLGATASTASAGIGRAGLVGSLSVPPSWVATTPAIRMLAAAVPDTEVQAVPVAAGMLSRMSLAGLAGGALGGLACRGGVSVRKSHTESAQLEILVAELSKQPNNPAVQHWHTDSTGFDSLVAELYQRPGIHAVHLSATNPAKTTPRSLPWG
ncbi:MAG: PPE family protein [Mycobacteriaceae bacterium]|nr:PPE family protein [Mycobacteriaceae bacterium]